MDIKDNAGKVIAKVTASGLDDSSYVVESGVWVELKTRSGAKPTLCLIQETGGDCYLGVYRNAGAKDIAGCDFAVRFTSDGPVLQAVKGTEVVTANLFDVLKAHQG